MASRKRRCDRNHIVYKVTCLPTGERYIGITVVAGKAIQKSVKTRWRKHLYHAIVENRDYPLQKMIRLHGSDAFKQEIVCVIRGKQAAHDHERHLIVQEKPELNVECTDKKSKRTCLTSFETLDSMAASTTEQL